MSAFTYKENPNRNPTSDFIDRAFQELGVPNVIHSLNRGRFQVVFDNDFRTDYQLRRDLIRMRACLYKYPFKSPPSPYNFSRGKPVEKKMTSLWHDFIETIMQRRHRVAHGDTLTNESTWEVLRQDSVKLEVLMYGIVYSSATYLVR